MKVRVLPLQPHCFAFGGFELQMLSVLEAVRECGVDAQPMDVWSRDADFEVLHVWGLSVAHAATLYWARQSGKGAVMTALLPYRTVERRVRHLAAMLAGQGRLRRKLLDMVDVLVVVNEAQAESACLMLGMPRERIAVIPHIIAAPYFEQPGEGAAPADVSDSYVLCTGNVCARKNQINLAKACLAVGCPLVIIGDVLPGEERYGEALARLIERRSPIRWLPGMPAGSPDLVEAYRNCRIFALPSREETQPIGALEAAAAGKPVLIGDRPYARQKYYRNACLVDTGSAKSIESGLRAVLAEPNRYVAPVDVLAECRDKRVGAAYKRVYEMAQDTPTRGVRNGT